ncbi:GNAT family N-acetyltransferase [Promicromonospora sp. NPDC060204]|uniref:GNAT family N-acetyltransferase n=1 Tax=Promicromonospora sp. NPDC060204 TaxID=3347071 RepID=UPI00364AFC45
MRITDFRPRQSGEAAEVAADAFADDPLWTHTVPDAGRRRLPHLIMLRAGLRILRPPQAARVALDDGRIIGLATWTTAGTEDPYDPFAPTQRVDPRLTRATRTLVRRAGADWPRLSALYATLAQSYPNEPGWFLGTLVVLPERQGTGVGSALLRDGLAQADAAGQPVSLQTSTTQNVEFYKRYGFEVTRTFAELYPGSPPLWNLRRPASAQVTTHAPSVPRGATPS